MANQTVNKQINFGRIQGISFFTSSDPDGSLITRDSVSPKRTIIKPLVGDLVIFGSGQIREIIGDPLTEGSTYSLSEPVAQMNVMGTNRPLKLWTGSRAEYDNIKNHDKDTLYFIG